MKELGKTKALIIRSVKLFFPLLFLRVLGALNVNKLSSLTIHRDASGWKTGRLTPVALMMMMMMMMMTLTTTMTMMTTMKMTMKMFLISCSISGYGVSPGEYHNTCPMSFFNRNIRNDPQPSKEEAMESAASIMYSVKLVIWTSLFSKLARLDPCFA